LTLKIHITANDVETVTDDDGNTVMLIEVDPGEELPIQLLSRVSKVLSEGIIRVIVEPTNQLGLLELVAKHRCDTRP
jgi:hypothetical protein